MSIILLPFRLIWFLIGFLFELMGRLVSGVLGAVLVIAGLVFAVTIVGMFIGIPFILLGVLLLIRSIF